MPALSLRSNVANVLVIGTGAAGLRAAIAAYQAGSEVVVIGKRRRDDAHTVLAAGGINAALGTVDPEDSWQQHFADTLREGYFLADPRVVELLARETSAAVLQLAEWGAPFARTPDGRLDQRFFGAHSWRRTCYAGDWTGRAILRALAAKVAELDVAVIAQVQATAGHPRRLTVHHGAPAPVSVSPTSGCCPSAALSSVDQERRWSRR
jgi:succinate dehydrogenase / fumarate reductase flavoprotein subunit